MAFPVRASGLGSTARRNAHGSGVRGRGRHHLALRLSAERAHRSIQVAKLRGSAFRSGRQTYRLSEDGITLPPPRRSPRKDDYRLAAPDEISPGARAGRHPSYGIGEAGEDRDAVLGEAIV